VERRQARIAPIAQQLAHCNNFMPTGAHSYCINTNVGHSEAQEKQSVYLLQAFQKTSDSNTSFNNL